MLDGLNRRSFQQLGVAASGAALAPRWMQAQAAPDAHVDRLAQMRAGGAATPIKATKLGDNVFLLQGAGGNMVLQTGAEFDAACAKGAMNGDQFAGLVYRTL